MQATNTRVDTTTSAHKPKTFLIGKPKKPGMRAAIAESRQIIADNLPNVIRELSKKAISGDGKASDATHLKLFLEISGVLKGGLGPQEKVVRERTFEEIMTERWEQDKLDREQLNQQARTQ